MPGRLITADAAVDPGGVFYKCKAVSCPRLFDGVGTPVLLFKDHLLLLGSEMMTSAEYAILDAVLPGSEEIPRDLMPAGYIFDLFAGMVRDLFSIFKGVREKIGIHLGHEPHIHQSDVFIIRDAAREVLDRDGMLSEPFHKAIELRLYNIGAHVAASGTQGEAPLVKVAPPEECFEEKTHMHVMLLDMPEFFRESAVDFDQFRKQAPYIKFVTLPVGEMPGEYLHDLSATGNLCLEVVQEEPVCHIGCYDIVFNIRHKVSDEPEMFNVFVHKELVVDIESDAVRIFLEEELLVDIPVFAGIYLEEADDIVHGLKGQLVDKKLLAPDGEDEAVFLRIIRLLIELIGLQTGWRS